MLARLSLRLKLQLLSGLAITAIIAIVLAGQFSIGTGVRSIHDLGEQRLPAVIAVQKLKAAQVALRSSTFEVALWENDSDAREQFSAILAEKNRQWQTAAEAWEAYDRLPRQPAEQTLWQELEGHWQRWRAVDQQINQVLQKLATNTSADQQAELFVQYFQLGGQQRQPFADAARVLAQLEQLNARQVQAETEAAESATRIANRALMIAGLLAALLVGGLSFLITRSILRQMGGDPSLAASITRAVAAGNLSVHIPVAAGDESSLLASMHYMQRNLRELIGQIMNSADRLAQSTRQLTHDMQQVASSGAAEGELATATAAAVEEISARISAIEAAAQTAQSLSQQAEAVAVDGQQVVDRAAQDMQAIAEAVDQTAQLVLRLGNQSQEISTVVNVIKEVADQTNLLALNAAIEAARAGEQGRGFAVVADEVRKLAERTAGSTQEIASRISSIQHGVQHAVSSMSSGGEQVERGVTMMDSATQAMGSIQTGARDAVAAVGSISESLRDSSGRLHSITRSMADIVNLVGRNGASVEAMAESVAGLEQLARELEEAAGAFQLQSA